MCGIAGIVDYERPSESNREAIAALTQRLRHRGPDGQGTALAAHAALGATRLAMVDRAGGAQPMRSPDGRHLIVYNGELYNHDALRAALPGPFRSRSDTETVLHAYREWGAGCVDRLDGMYAFFVWDDEAQRGFAARDRLGVKPFAYRASDGRFTFASEASALVDRPRADLDAVVEALVAPCMSGVSRAAFEGVEYLPPGCSLTVDRAGARAKPYWSFRFERRDDEDPEELIRELRAAFVSSVERSLRADVPLGVFLSGGLDSTAIAAVARRSIEGLPAWTIRFDDESSWEGASKIVVSCDTPHARLAASELGLTLHEAPFDRSRIHEELRAVAKVDDAIPAWEQELSQRWLARAASVHVKGVLVGDAADETHYGYHFLLDDAATRTPSAILERLGTVPIRREVDPDPVARLDAEYRALAEEAGGRFDADRAARVEATTHLIVRRWLPRLLHNGDVHTMAFGLEARVPFASVRLLEVAARVSVALGLAQGVEKAALRRALVGLVPDAIRTRRKSALPKDQGVAAAYREELRQVLRDPHPLVRAVVELDALSPLAEREMLSEVERAQVFRVVSLSHWARAHAVRSP